MHKKDKQLVMNALAMSHTPEFVVLRVIKNMADLQFFKVCNAYNKFCVDCAIYYTSNPTAMSEAIKEGINLEVWSNEFIKKVEAFER